MLTSSSLSKTSVLRLSTYIHRQLNRPYFASTQTVLGIETSCDDTGCAIVDSNAKVLSETLFSQNIVHLRYGGVNPTVARDLHRDNIELAVSTAIQNSKIEVQNVNAVAVTVKPGLLASLQIGVKYGMFLAKKYNKVLIPIHHMEAHALVARMFHTINFPFIALLISGGHCLLCLVRDVNDFILLGETLDNAPGEILDKMARRLKLRNIPDYSKFPGGRAIELAAGSANKLDYFHFPVPMARVRDCNFSFSGLKNAFDKHLAAKEFNHGILGDEIIPEVNELCASFQMAIVQHIIQRTERAIKFCELNNFITSDNKTIVVSGGVACNNFIFKHLQLLGNDFGFNVVRPPPKVCTDNGVMIAWNGIEKMKKKLSFKKVTLNDVDPAAALGVNISKRVAAAGIQVKLRKIKHL
ncbi:tRNA N6-adenosine threonylcarbamoyltransferase, mitochondrial-like [Leptidea sinapis]|uniref:tRNA N6-adenosine threonylcarbamoyltransferase, mitochondrial-like n=1 Tax=Leptidea sinapis TaxID=189913 RepID=UPI0021C3F012|nr:tRNA N6-adenosine threonylcarbamoyltransferase, mitochondrial-like [Leptidea sinapis]